MRNFFSEVFYMQSTPITFDWTVNWVPYKQDDILTLPTIHKNKEIDSQRYFYREKNLTAFTEP